MLVNLGDWEVFRCEFMGYVMTDLYFGDDASIWAVWLVTFDVGRMLNDDEAADEKNAPTGRGFIPFQTCMLDETRFGALMTYYHKTLTLDTHQTSTSHHRRPANKLTPSHIHQTSASHHQRHTNKLSSVASLDTPTS